MAGPEVCFENRLVCPADLEICELGADTVRSLLPIMERLGIVTREVVQPNSLAERMHAQAVETDSLTGVMPMVGHGGELDDSVAIAACAIGRDASTDKGEIGFMKFRLRQFCG